LDTGSDGTILPAETGRALNLDAFPSSRATVLGIGGKPEQRVLYGVVVKINGFEVRSVVDVRDDVEIVLVGRDILQHTTVTINWKEKTLTVKDP
jgi:predicted aspartyl protease